MASEQASALRALARTRSDAQRRRAARRAWWALWASRGLVWAGGLLGIWLSGRAPGTRGFDPAGLTEPFGSLGNLLVAPAARWDSVWYLAIAQHGYTSAQTDAFFPLYPLLVATLGGSLLAAMAVSLAAFGAALYLLARLAELDLGEQHVPAVLALTVLFPGSLFFSGVYTESLFLALSVGAVYAARLGRWPLAGLAAGFAAATRNGGVLLLIPLAILFLYGPREDAPDLGREPQPGGGRAARALAALRPRHRLDADALWLLMVPAALAAFLLYLGLSGRDALGPFHAQRYWYHHFAGPFGGVWDGLRAAWDGARQLLHGSGVPRYFGDAGGDALGVARLSVILGVFLAATVPATVGVLRRLPLAYGSYVLVALGTALSYPVGPQPLESLPRYEAVLFPLFMWGALWLARRPRLRAAVYIACAAGLCFFAGRFATWRFIA